MAGDILVAATTAAVVWQGRSIVIEQDVTLARAGHPILDAYGSMFVPLVITFDVDKDTDSTPPTAEPESTEADAETPADGTPDPKAVRAWAAEAGIEVSPKGKLPAAVVEQYQAAQQGA